MITISVLMEDPTLASNIVNFISEWIQTYVSEEMSFKATKNREFIEKQLANAKAIENGDKEWETKIDNCLWKQKSFPYQAKCLKWVNEEYSALEENDRIKVNNLLDGTGCERLIL